MYKLHVPLAELVGRLVNLNEDRRRNYSLFSDVSSQTLIRIKCGELASQSNSNLDELDLLGLAYRKYAHLCEHFTISPSLWVELENARHHKDLFFIASKINNIEEHFHILYKLVCRMLPFPEDKAGKIIRNQCQSLLKSKEQIPHLFIQLN